MAWPLVYFLDNPPSQNARSPEKKAPAAKPRHEPARNGHLEKFELPVVVVVVLLLLQGPEPPMERSDNYSKSSPPSGPSLPPSLCLNMTTV